MPVKRQLDRVSSQLQSLDGLCQADKDVNGSQGKRVADITQRLYYNQINQWDLKNSTCDTVDNIHVFELFLCNHTIL